MITFDHVSRIDQATDFFGEIEHGRQIFPVILPRFDGNGVFLGPRVSDQAQMSLGLLTVGCLIGGFEVGDEGFALFSGDIF